MMTYITIHLVIGIMIAMVTERTIEEMKKDPDLVDTVPTLNNKVRIGFILIWPILLIRWLFSIK
jgi:hypothetical protein